MHFNLKDTKVVKTIGRGTYCTVYLLKNDTTTVYKHFESKNNDGIMSYNYLNLELSTLRKIDNHPNIVTCKNLIEYSGLVTGYTMLRYHSDLHQSLRKNRTEETKRKMMYQILHALCHVHNNGFIHSDIKPSNILIDSKDNVYLIDFNSIIITPINPYVEKKYSIVTTLWYRAPEIALKYSLTPAIDIWSLGTVFCELHQENLGVFINPNVITDNEKSQHELHETQKKFSTDPSIIVEKLQFNNIIKQDLIFKMLNYDHKKRQTAKMLLKHEYFNSEININVISPTIIKQKKYPTQNALDIELCAYFFFIKSTIDTSHVYTNIKHLQNEICHFAHYLLNTVYLDDIPISKQLIYNTLIALKILDPHNTCMEHYIEIEKDIEHYEQLILNKINYNIHFQDTVYSKCYTLCNNNKELIRYIEPLLLAFLHMSYNESTTLLAQKLYDYAKLYKVQSEPPKEDTYYWKKIKFFL
jgi:serine/threonine protein kinase|uniref:Protein kinase domain-containing protein n=1 Tax=viral metagenome TaxID=1070528 RepID=A0A6C0J1J5_9ZZZZ